jgi:CubicO group peptidase (beta-lactamase class C family)
MRKSTRLLLSLPFFSAALVVRAAPSPTHRTASDACPASVPQKATVDSVVNEAARTFLKETAAVGLSIGVVKGERTYTYNFGTMKKGKDRPPTADTLYGIASVTKTFTATLLAQAVMEGKVKLDDDIRKYLNDAYPNLEYEGQPIRLVHLLNHNSGLPVSLPAPESSRPQSTKEYTREEFYKSLHKVRLGSVPGTKLGYSNAAAQLMGFILERVYGMRYEDLVRVKIAEPLKMKNTKITLSRAEQERFKGYDENGSVVSTNTDSLQAAGALKSTVADLLKYASWHLAEKDEATKLSHKPHWKINDTYSIGLNWQMFQLRGYRFIWQEGSLPGYGSFCAIVPELQMGIVVLTNEFDRNSSTRLTRMVKQIVKELEPRAADLP